MVLRRAVLSATHAPPSRCNATTVWRRCLERHRSDVLVTVGLEDALHVGAVGLVPVDVEAAPGAPDAAYVGGELEFATFVKLNAGWLWRTGSSAGQRSMFNRGVGLGF
jgi:hypothetical protein